MRHAPLRHGLAAGLLAAAVAVSGFGLAPAASATGAHHRAATYYVAPSGDDRANGSKRHPFASLRHAQDQVRPGDTVYLRGGEYSYDRGVTECAGPTSSIDAVLLDKSGRSGSPITYAAYPGETPVLDFDDVRDNCRVRGIDVSASWIVLRGLTVTGVRQNNNLNNESWGIWVNGDNNVFDQIETHHNMGAGLFIQDGAGNLVKNCDSHDNYDPNSKTGAGQNADGFGSHTNTPSDAVNVFQGDRAWNNADDGFDFISSSSPVEVTHSWSWHNGYVYDTDEEAASGNGTGFKLGGYGGDYEENSVKVSLSYSVAFDNTLRGIYANHHPLADDVHNNTAFDNGANYNMLGVAPDGSDVNLGHLRNNISFGTGENQNMTGDGVDSASNSWDLGLDVTQDDFVAVSHDGWDAPRQRDGSLPDLDLLKPAEGSPLIDAGTSIGASYTGNAPDLGAFEYGDSPVSVAASPQCRGRSVSLAADVTNESSRTVVVNVKTPYGTRNHRTIRAHSTISVVFRTHSRTIPAGRIDVSTADHHHRTVESTDYDSVSCTG